MARVHKFYNIFSEGGRPINGVSVSVYLAGTTSPARIYTQEIGGVARTTAPQLTTDSKGFFEFWVPDSQEVGGYEDNQKFKVAWSKAGIIGDEIDNIDVFALTSAFFETGTAAERIAYTDPQNGQRWHEDDTAKDQIYDDSTSTWHNIIKNINGVVLETPRTAAPTAPLSAALYVADAVNWNPLSRAASAGPYIVWYTGNAYKAVSGV